MRFGQYDISATDNKLQFVVATVATVKDKKSKNFGNETLSNQSYHSSWGGVVRKLAKLELMDAVSELDGVEATKERFVNNLMQFESEIKKVLGR